MVPGAIEVAEREPVSIKTVEHWCKLVVIAKSLHEQGAHRFHKHYHYVFLFYGFFFERNLARQRRDAYHSVSAEPLFHQLYGLVAVHQMERAVLAALVVQSSLK